MKEQVFDLLVQMHKEREEQNRHPHFVTFMDMAERNNILNMKMYLRELYKEGRIEFGKTVNDVWFAPHYST